MEKQSKIEEILTEISRKEPPTIDVVVSASPHYFGDALAELKYYSCIKKNWRNESAKWLWERLRKDFEKLASIMDRGLCKSAYVCIINEYSSRDMDEWKRFEKKIRSEYPRVGYLYPQMLDFR